MPNAFNNNNLQDCFNLALLNIIKHGDTDIFPYPLRVVYSRTKRYSH